MPRHLQQQLSNDRQTEEVVLANRYKVLKKLGSGSYGTVFLIEDLKSNKELKVLKKISIGDVEPDDTISAVSEARLLAKLTHPGIVKFYDSFINGEHFCIVTEFCEGGDLDVKLHHWKKTGKAVDKSLVITWFIQLVLAVQYMHQRRVLHRDLKSRNVFLKNNMIKIGDFGISRILQSTADFATTVTGTPYYMAPEILRHEGYNSKSDVWSLGVILYEMCTLRKPFEGDSLVAVMMGIVNGDVPHLPSKFDRELNDIFSRMLNREPTQRISSAEILKTHYIKQHLQTLKLKIANDYHIADNTINIKKETHDIAEAVIHKKFKKPSSRRPLPQLPDKSRPMTPGEQLRLRKQQKAEKEAERLKKVTENAYKENRRKYSKIKAKQSQVEVFRNNDVNKKLTENDSNLCDSDANFRGGVGDFGNKKNADYGNHVIQKNGNNYEISGDEVFDSSDISVVNLSEYVTQKQPKRDYTHCFGEDSSDEEQENENVFEDHNETTNDASDLTLVSDIPDDASVADTYYSLNDDFEEDVSSIASDEEDDTCEYSALVGCMENALDLKDDDNTSTFGDSRQMSVGSESLRKQRIKQLRMECIKLLGESSFKRVYNYLKRVRFQSDSPVNEQAIMLDLRKLVDNARDCFLVDQLLFLEKQDEIAEQTL